MQQYNLCISSLQPYQPNNCQSITSIMAWEYTTTETITQGTSFDSAMPPGEQHRPQTELHRRFQHTLREKFPGKICHHHHHHHHHGCWSGHNGPHAPLQQTDANCQTRKPTLWCLCAGVCSERLQHKWLFDWYLNAQSTTKLLWVGRGGSHSQHPALIALSVGGELERQRDRAN